MPTFLDESAITGVAPKAPAGAPAALPKGAQFLDEAAITGVDAIERSAVESQTAGAKVRAVASDVAKYTAGTLGTAADMILGSPAMVAGYFAHVAGRVGAQVRDPGISQKTAAGAGAAYKEELIPSWAYAPLSAAIEKLSPEALHYLNNSPLGQLMGLASKGIEVGADLAEKRTGMPAEDLKAGIEGLMGAAGVKGGKVTAEALAKRIEAAAKKRKEAGETAAPPAEAAPDTSVPYDTAPAKADPTTRKAALDAQIKAEQQARSGVQKQIKAAAKYQKMADRLEEGDPLKVTLQERADLAAEEAATAQAELKAKAPKSDLEERVGGTTYSPGHELAAEVRDIAAKPGHLRTPEEIVRLRGAMRELKQKQGGKLDPELGAWIAAGGLTALSGTLLYQLYSKYRDRQDRMTPEERDQDDAAKKDLMKEFEREQMEEHPRPNPPEDWRDRNEKPIFTAQADLTEAMGAGLLLAGAVKGKGGMWHPEAVERLSRPLQNRLITGEEVALDARTGKPANPKAAARAMAALQWSDSRIRSYLNKHAGTEGDPLAGVELPSGKKWGEVTDALIYGKEIKGPRGPETQWDVQDMADPARAREQNRAAYAVHNELPSYLSHVGDFLRQNVAPEKLQQYDLVRAVKETAANDARMAKEMERAAAASMKDMPVYKDYGDGMKWVELKLPKKLTEEQARSIKEGEDGYGGRGYQPVDAQGKPIKNNYTGDSSVHETPEEAHLAGQLAQEGNCMGHCVGGYAADVASGQTRILSLRDAKGRSHVTVEIAPQFKDPVRFYHDADPAFQARYPRPTNDLGGRFREWEAAIEESPEFQEHLNTDVPSIQQIKGKQNRAPDARYLPYVQDLVKGGKWGEVGDLGNTGLHDLRQSKINSVPYKQLAEEFHPGQDFITQPEFEKLQAEGIKRTLADKQRGSADPRLLAAIAAAGGVAAYLAANPDSRDSLLAFGLLGMHGKGAKGFLDAARTVGRGLDYTLGAVSTRLGNISPALRFRAVDFERRVHENLEHSLTAITPMLRVLKDAPEGSPLDLALLDNKGVEVALPKTPEARSAWTATKQLLAGFEAKHKELGRFKEGLSNYFPRIVDDLDGLKKALGQEQRTSLEEALMKAEAKMVKEQQRGLTDVETSLIVNQSLRARPEGSHLPGYAHNRGVETLTAELRPFYASPADSLLRYVSAATQDIEMARFFGRDLATKKTGGHVLTDVDGSIGNVVAQELKKGNITHEQANEVRSMLKARFSEREKTMAGPLQDVRNATNVALLGQFGSAATQIGDSVMTLYHHGLMPTLTGLKQKLTGSSRVTTKEFGLVNHIAEELSSNRFTGRALQAVFKANGFSLIDQFAKGLNLNAGLVKNQRLAKSERGQAQLAAKYAEAMGEDFAPMLEDLRNGVVSDRVKSLLFSELSDAQPITKMEMPQAYLDHPNGRLFYQMKTYMLKQMDVIRRDAYNQIKAGNYVTGAKNLVAVASALALSNIPGDVVKDWISGRDASLDKIDYTEALLRNFGVSRYTMDKIGQGKPLEVLADMAAPPYKHFQDLFVAAMPGAKPQQEARAAKYIPLVGRPLYDRNLGGNEARAKIEAQRLRLEARDAREAAQPVLKEIRLRKQEAKRQKELSKYRQ